jgi:hypothetical protein
MQNTDDFELDGLEEAFEQADEETNDFEELDFANRGFGSGGDGDEDWYYGDDDDATEDYEDYGFSEDEQS